MRSDHLQIRLLTPENPIAPVGPDITRGKYIVGKHNLRFILNLTDSQKHKLQSNLLEEKEREGMKELNKGSI
jgi:hypothetical protein